MDPKLFHKITRLFSIEMKKWYQEIKIIGCGRLGREGAGLDSILNRLERTPRLEIATPALFLWHTSAPGWNNAFINFNQNGWFPAPNYVVLKLWRDHFLPNRISMEGETKHLNIAATASDDKKQVCVKDCKSYRTPCNDENKGRSHARHTRMESNSCKFPDRK